MKAISIKQPWASLVAAGHKTIECRTWAAKYRGPLLICSSKGDVKINDGMTAPGGMALGVVDFFDVRKMTRADMAAAFVPEGEEYGFLSLLGWHVRKIYEVIPFPVKGKLSFFEVEDALINPLPSSYDDHCDYLHSLKGRG